MEPLIVIYACAELVLALHISFSNFVVIWVYVRSRHVRTPTNAYIFSLAVTDFLAGALGIPATVFSVLTRHPRDFMPCLAIHLCLCVLCTVSTFHLLAIAIDKYLTICCKRCQLFFDRSADGTGAGGVVTVGGGNRQMRAKLLIALAWIAGAAIASMPLFDAFGFATNTRRHFNNECHFTVVVDYHYLVYVIFFATIVAPSALIAYCYASIYAKIRSEERQIKCLLRAAERQRRMNSRRKLIRIMLILWGAYAVCWYPLYLLNTFDLFLPSVYHSTPEVTLAAVVLSHLNCTLNPIIYAYGVPGFKHSLRRFLPFCADGHGACGGGGAPGGAHGTYATSAAITPHYSHYQQQLQRQKRQLEQQQQQQVCGNSVMQSRNGYCWMAENGGGFYSNAEWRNNNNRNNNNTSKMEANNKSVDDNSNGSSCWARRDSSSSSLVLGGSSGGAGPPPCSPRQPQRARAQNNLTEERSDKLRLTPTLSLRSDMSALSTMQQQPMNNNAVYNRSFNNDDNNIIINNNNNNADSGVGTPTMPAGIRESGGNGGKLMDSLRNKFYRMMVSKDESGEERTYVYADSYSNEEENGGARGELESLSFLPLKSQQQQQQQRKDNRDGGTTMNNSHSYPLFSWRRQAAHRSDRAPNGGGARLVARFPLSVRDAVLQLAAPRCWRPNTESTVVVTAGKRPEETLRNAETTVTVVTEGGGANAVRLRPAPAEQPIHFTLMSAEKDDDEKAEEENNAEEERRYDGGVGGSTESAEPDPIYAISSDEADERRVERKAAYRQPIFPSKSADVDEGRDFLTWRSVGDASSGVYEAVAGI